MDNKVQVVLLESPFSGNIQRNVAYTQRAMADSRQRNEAPIITHLLWTQHHEKADHFVSDYDPKYTLPNLGRESALEQLKAIRRRVHKVVFLVDYGYSNGMKHGLEHCKKEGIPYEERKLGNTEEDEVNAKRREAVSSLLKTDLMESSSSHD